ncbi:MAG TPA: hypothetical protein VGQ21_05800 [Thermoanaerobaculia bacterium]|jgi:hypothetical protein|nr:hypothetical protein [Thermoanaerobaculia bacterium]
MRDDAPSLGVANLDAIRAEKRGEIGWKKPEEMHHEKPSAKPA